MTKAAKKVEKISNDQPMENKGGMIDMTELADEFIAAKEAYDRLMETSKTIARFEEVKERVKEVVDQYYGEDDTAEIAGSGETGISVSAKGKNLAMRDTMRKDFIKRIGKETFMQSFTFPMTTARKILSQQELDKFYEVTGRKARTIRLKKIKK